MGFAKANGSTAWLAQGAAGEDVERAKVMRALYCRDKALYVNYGSDLWMSNYAYRVADRHRVDKLPSDEFADRIKLAVVQEDIYRLAQALPRRDAGWRRETRNLSQAIERQLSQFSQQLEYSSILCPRTPGHTAWVLELLATRILASQTLPERKNAQQMVEDSRASCDLLLAALGSAASEGSSNGHVLSDVSVTQIGEILDAFSLPAFFILLQCVLEGTPEADGDEDVDHCRVEEVTQCYREAANRVETNSYYSRVALTLSHFLTATNRSKGLEGEDQLQQLAPTPPGGMVPAALSSRSDGMIISSSNGVQPAGSISTSYSTLPAAVTGAVFDCPPQSAFSTFPNADLSTPSASAFMNSFFDSTGPSDNSAYPLLNGANLMSCADMFGPLMPTSKAQHAPGDDSNPFLTGDCGGGQSTMVPDVLAETASLSESGTSSGTGAYSSGSRSTAGSGRNSHSTASKKRRRQDH
jgi:hypothetical protein